MMRVYSDVNYNNWQLLFSPFFFLYIIAENKEMILGIKNFVLFIRLINYDW